MRKHIVVIKLSLKKKKQGFFLINKIAGLPSICTLIKTITVCCKPKFPLKYFLYYTLFSLNCSSMSWVEFQENNNGLYPAITDTVW